MTIKRRKLSFEPGEKFASLTILKEIEPKVYNYNNRVDRVRRVLCKCDCGTVREFNLYQILIGRTKSCGCIQKGFFKREKPALKHGMSSNQTRLYRIWSGMHTRCYNEKQKCYKYYGGKGVIICDEWKNDFVSFYKWSMSNGYSDVLTIDRIDTNGNYEPSNCRWVTWREQQNNKNQKWKEEEDVIIMRKDLSAREKAKMTNRTIGAVYTRIHKIKSICQQQQ